MLWCYQAPWGFVGAVTSTLRTDRCEARLWRNSWAYRCGADTGTYCEVVLSYGREIIQNKLRHTIAHGLKCIGAKVNMPRWRVIDTVLPSELSYRLTWILVMHCCWQMCFINDGYHHATNRAIVLLETQWIVKFPCTQLDWDWFQAAITKSQEMHLHVVLHSCCCQVVFHVIWSVPKS